MISGAKKEEVMENFRKSMLMLIIGVLSIFIIACNGNEKETGVKKQEEINQDAIVKLTEISTEEIIKQGEEKIKNVAEGFEHAKIVKLNIYEDPLLMEANKNKKKYHNIMMEVVLNLSKDVDFKDRDEVTGEYANSIYEEFKYGDDGHFRLSNISVNYTIDGQTGKSVHIYKHSFGFIGKELESLKVDQDEEDLKAQTLVFNGIEKNEEMSLERIGIDGDKFIIEIKIFDPQKEGYDVILKTVSDYLAKLLLGDSEVENYLIDNSTKNISIYWDMIWYKGNEAVQYDYRIE